jgi:hypothetical protein
VYVSILCSRTTKVKTETKCSDMKCFWTDVNIVRRSFKTVPKCAQFIGKWMYMVPSVLPFTFLFPTMYYLKTVNMSWGKLNKVRWWIGDKVHLHFKQNLSSGMMGNLFFTPTARPHLGPLSLLQGLFLLGVKCIKCETNHSPQSTSKV